MLHSSTGQHLLAAETGVLNAKMPAIPAKTPTTNANAVPSSSSWLFLLREVYSRIREAAEAVVNGQAPEAVAKRFSKHVDPKDLVVWAHDFERLSEADFVAKYSSPGRRPRSNTKSALSLKDTAVAARSEEQRLEALERQLTEQLAAVRREKKDVEELLGFLERKRGAAAAV